jgi:hypothetical protein
MALCAFCASARTYPHCCKYTRDTPYLPPHQSRSSTAGMHGIQQVALEAQSHRRCRIDDSLTRFRYIDVEHLLACDSLQAGFGTECCDEPAKCEEMTSTRQLAAYQTVATPYLRFVRTMLSALGVSRNRSSQLTLVTVKHDDTKTLIDTNAAERNAERYKDNSAYTKWKRCTPVEGVERCVEATSLRFLGIHED